MKNPLDRIHSSWKPLLTYLNQEPLLTLNTDILPNNQYYPSQENIFRVFETPLSEIKAVILGQDPYHGPNQANGLAFSVNSHVPITPSLKIIEKEVVRSIFNKNLVEVLPSINHEWKTLEHWKQQGIFLLNTGLTVQAGLPGSHLRYWNTFIRATISYIAINNPCIWFLWGKSAQSFTINMPAKSLFEIIGYDRTLIEEIPISPHFNYILKAAHPAAECYRDNAGFLNCDHFYLSNRLLDKLGKKQINW